MDLHAWRHGWLDRIVGLKYFNVFGPNESHKGDMRSMVNKSFEQVRDGGALHLFKSYRPDYKDGEQKRDFLYVKDAVAMTLFLAATPSASGIFNIGCRPGAQLERTGSRRICRIGPAAAHRVHRNARGDSRAVSIFYAGRHRQAARRRL